MKFRTVSHFHAVTTMRLTLAALLLLPSSLFARHISLPSFFATSPTAIATLNAGDFVRVEATLYTTDPDDLGNPSDGGENLVLETSSGSVHVVVSDYLSPHVFEFTVAQNGEQLRAYIINGDGDEVANIQIEISQIVVSFDQQSYQISDLPAMPKVTATASIPGLSPDPSANTMFTWSYDIHYNPKEFGDPHGPDIDFDHDFNDVNGANKLVLDFKGELRGGTLTVTAKAVINGMPLKGSSMVNIAGANPSITTVEQALGNNFTLWRIASKESSFQQFLGGDPQWSRDNLGGVGLMQITDSTLSDDQLNKLAWDWRANVKAGQKKFDYGVGIARALAKSVERSSAFSDLVDQYNFYKRTRQNLPPLKKISIPPLTTGDFNCNIQQFEMETIRVYNGTAGRDEVLDRPLQEFTLEIDGDGFLVVDVAKKSSEGTARWIRVGASQRPSRGDPDYVNKVLMQLPNLCH